MRGWVKKTYGGVNAVTVVFNTGRPGREHPPPPNKTDSGLTPRSLTAPGCEIGFVFWDCRPEPFIIHAFPLYGWIQSRFIPLPSCFHDRG